MDTFTLFAIKNELKQKVLFKRINKIFQNNNLFTFKLSSGESLFFDFNTIFLANLKLEHPYSPPAFCMLLRKYICNSIITDLKFFKFYRIIELVLEKRKEIFTLQINFAGKSKNLILRNNLKILGSFRKFQAPVIKSFKKLSIEEFRDSLIKGSLEGFPPFVIDEFIFLVKEANIYEAYEKYVNLFNYHIEFTPIKVGNKFYPFYLSYLKHMNHCKVFPNFNEMLKYQFENQFLNIEKNKLIKLVKKRIKKLKKSIEKIDKEMEQKKNYNEYFKFGELLKANIHLIKKGDDFAEVIDYYDENMKKIKIPLNKAKSPHDNVENFFNLGKKYKRGIEKLADRKKEIEQQLNALYEELYFIENSDKPAFNRISSEKKSKINNGKELSQKPFKEFEYKNYKIIAGKSSKGNDFIIRKFGKPDFVWMHAKDFPGSHVIIIEKEENINMDVLEYAGKIALENSKARENKKGEVIYTKIKYLQKPKGAPSGFVTLKKFKTIFVKLY